MKWKGYSSSGKRNRLAATCEKKQKMNCGVKDEYFG